MKLDLPAVITVAGTVCVGLMAGCEADSAGDPDESERIVVEWMRHEDGGLSVEHSTRIGTNGEAFELAGTSFRILERWPHSEAHHETLDDNPEESHAVELAWGSSVDGERQSEWIHQSSGSDEAVGLAGTELRVRVLPAGARPGWKSLWSEDPRRTVQFEVAGNFYALPSDHVEAFPGWIVQRVQCYERALLDESGAVRECEDDSFMNRAVEVVLASEDGTTVERHLAFLDHPELTKGIHPVLLPVSRLSGQGASQSRLVVCESLDRPGAGDALVLCPDPLDSRQLTAFTWDQAAGSMNERKIDGLPAEIKLAAGQGVQLLRHWTHARAVVKWRRREEDAGAESFPAMVVGWAEDSAEPKEAVLIKDRPTSFRLRGEFHTFRFRSADSTPHLR